jgi:soluble lytic murein transglycosylase-like protein
MEKALRGPAHTQNLLFCFYLIIILRPFTGEKMMQASPFKKSVFLLLFLLLIGISGLVLGFIDSNRNYERSLAHIHYLQANLGDLHGRLLQMNEESMLNEKKYARVDFLEYQNTIFQKKFPDFSKIVNITYNKSKFFGFHPNLILAVMQVESAFNPLAFSTAGAYGLMQVHYAVWKDELKIDKDRIFEIEYNIGLGLKILKQYYDLSGGDLKRALFLYNNGYKYNNTGYITKVNNSIYNQDPDPIKLAGVSQ